MKLQTSPQWAKRAVVRIFEQQTDEEKRKHLAVSGRNGVGFNRFDSPILSRIARRVMRGHITLEDIEILHIRMPKYSRQIFNLADKTKLRERLDIYYSAVQDRFLPI